MYEMGMIYMLTFFWGGEIFVDNHLFPKIEKQCRIKDKQVVRYYR